MPIMHSTHCQIRGCFIACRRNPIFFSFFRRYINFAIILQVSSSAKSTLYLWQLMMETLNLIGLFLSVFQSFAFYFLSLHRHFWSLISLLHLLRSFSQQCLSPSSINFLRSLFVFVNPPLASVAEVEPVGKMQTRPFLALSQMPNIHIVHHLAKFYSSSHRIQHNLFQIF